MLDKMFHEIYKGKTVLVTGHTGFKGSWLSIWLNELGAKVIGYSLNPYTEKDNFVLSGISEKMVDIREDIRDYKKLKEVFDKYKPEIVFHLAAQPLVRLSYDIPRDTYEINVMGTVNVLECIRQSSSVQAGIMITSDKCYENKEVTRGYIESDKMGGYDTYSSSKGCSELVVSAYRNSFFNANNPENNKAIASVRAGNVIGGGDWASDRIIPDCIKAFESGKPIEVRNPEAIRPWQHVIEPLNGYLLLGSKMYQNRSKYSEGWNFGPEISSIVPVKDIVEKVISYYGKGEFIDVSNKTKVHEAKLLSLDITKAKDRLGWNPKLSIDKAIELTADWYKRYKEENVYDLCVKQISKL